MTSDNFFSIDRLVEFGLNMAIAQQMVKTMNQAMANMYIPGVMNNPQPNPKQLFYVILDEKQFGPLSEQDLSRLIADGKIVKETYIWMPGMEKWDIAKNISDVLRLVALTPPPFKGKD